MTRAVDTTSWRTRSLAGYALVVAVLCAAGAWALFGPLTSALIDQQEENLIAVAQAGALAVADPDVDLDLTVRRLVARTSLRVTVVDASGTVLADTDRDPATMDDHSDRPEVAQALTGDVGRDQRISDTEGTEQLYVAVPVTRDGEKLALRVSASVAVLAGMASSARNAGLALLGVGLVLSVIIAWRSLSFASRPVERLQRVRSDFVANASHELKTPVAGIRLLAETAETLLAEGDVEGAAQFVGRIDTEAIRLQHLVGDLLDLSRLEGTRPMSETTDARSTLRESVESRAERATARGLTLEFVDDARLVDACRVAMTRSDLRLVVDNLVDNAINYTESGGVTVRLDADDAEVRIEVHDTGIGLADDELPRVFERFYRVDRARSRDTGGTGLGLALVRNAVERAGGTITVRSELDAGSTFSVHLPRA